MVTVPCLPFWQFASNFFEVCQPVCRPVGCPAPCHAPHYAPCHPACSQLFEPCPASGPVGPVPSPASMRMPQQANNQGQSVSASEATGRISRQELASLSKEQLQAIFLDQKEKLPRRMQAFEQLRVLHTLMPQPPPRPRYSSFRRALTPPRFLTPRLPSPLKTVLSRIDPRQKSPPREHAHKRSKSPLTALVGDLVSKSPAFESHDVSECSCLLLLFL